MRINSAKLHYEHAKRAYSGDKVINESKFEPIMLDQGTFWVCANYDEGQRICKAFLRRVVPLDDYQGEQKAWEAPTHPYNGWDTRIVTHNDEKWVITNEHRVLEYDRESDKDGKGCTFPEPPSPSVAATPAPTVERKTAYEYGVEAFGKGIKAAAQDPTFMAVMQSDPDAFGGWLAALEDYVKGWSDAHYQSTEAEAAAILAEADEPPAAPASAAEKLLSPGERLNTVFEQETGQKPIPSRCTKCKREWTGPDAIRALSLECCRCFYCGGTLEALYRQTSPGKPTVADLVKRGMWVKTNYNTGGVVTEVSQHKGTGGMCFTIVYVDARHANHFGTKTEGRHLCWINECVAVGGQILKLFTANKDEVFIVEPPADFVMPIEKKQLTLF